MSDDDVSFSISLPLDSEGFLRRECPTCEREFKWLHEEDEVGDGEAPDGGYYCPYCGVQAPFDAWFTNAQVELIENAATIDVLGPLVKDFSKDLNRIGRRSSGLLDVTTKFDEPDRMDPLTSDEDMVLVDPVCHPAEPVKILTGWERTVYCLICGQPI